MNEEFLELKSEEEQMYQIWKQATIRCDEAQEQSIDAYRDYQSAFKKRRDYEDSLIASDNERTTNQTAPQAD